MRIRPRGIWCGCGKENALKGRVKELPLCELLQQQRCQNTGARVKKKGGKGRSRLDSGLRPVVENRPFHDKRRKDRSRSRVDLTTNYCLQ